MATTAIFPIHAGRRSVVKALGKVIDYMENPLKTLDGELVSSFDCAPETADLEFSLAHSEYQKLTGRNQGKSTVIGYHARQSFAPGEITPEEANRLGYELAGRFTKGRHAFIVATHIDKAHIHNHIVWSSVTLDYRRKFRNFIMSAFALRRVSDLICLENGYSIIEHPKPSPGRDYGKHVFGDDRPPSFQARLKAAIDNALAQSPPTFEDFLALIKAAGIVAERRGKHLRFKLPDQQRPTRLETLGGDYTEEAIRERIDGRRIVSAPKEISATDGREGSVPVPVGKIPATRSTPSTHGASSTFGVPSTQAPSLLIDIESKIREGKGRGYQHWASAQNLKQMAKTLIFLQERGLTDYAVLKEKTVAATDRFNSLSDRLKTLESQLTANGELQKQIVTYVKTKATYAEYRKAGYSKAFKETHEADIILHQAAKETFDTLGYSYGKDGGKKLPTVAELRSEYAPILDEKKRTYAEYRKARDEMKELLVAKSNVDRLLNITENKGGRETERPEI